jgi:hypothetical protein
MSSKPFAITSFAWRQDIENRLAAAGESVESEEIILARLTALAQFLESNALTTRKLTDSQNLAQRDFILSSEDLTELGLLLIRKGYVKWQRQAKSPIDVRPLQKALTQLQHDRPTP